VLRDIIAVLVFSALLVLVRPLASPGAVHPLAFGAPLVTLAASVFAGALLAWLVSRYRRLLGVDPGFSSWRWHSAQRWRGGWGAPRSR
jgi:hypothetical protein